MQKIALFLLLVLSCGLLFSGFKAWEQATVYEKETINLIKQLDTESNFESTGLRLLELLSLGIYTGYSEKLKELVKQKERQQTHRRSAWYFTGGFFIIAIPVMVLSLLLRSDWCDMAYTMLGISIIALVIGLITPILTVSAQKDLPVIGETVLQFQSKGIVSTILGLKDAGNVWLALLLSLFSVIIPITKTSLVAVTVFARSHKLSLKGLGWSRGIGKWSMADVFVVAVLVVFFANEQNGLTQAEVQVGLCFFAGYVVLSMLSASVINYRLNSMNGNSD